MAFYDGLGKKIQQTGQGAIDKTKKGAETVKHNSAISNLEREISQEYTEIGRLYYQQHADEPQDADMAPHFQTISDKMAEIEEHRAQVDELKGMRKCTNCGAMISGTATFCNYCGARQVPEYTAQSESEPAAGFCPNCGAALEEGQMFCTECGTRIEPETEDASDSAPTPAQPEDSQEGA